MAGQGKKRTLDDSAAAPKSKKPKVAQDDATEKAHRKTTKSAPAPAPAPAQEVDFPRGGGSSFTPAEYKAIRSEAVREADDELTFEVRIPPLHAHSS